MITESERELRTRYIGSSDAAAVCGLNPYRSAYDCWLEKTHRVEPFPRQRRHGSRDAPGAFSGRVVHQQTPAGKKSHDQK